VLGHTTIGIMNLVFLIDNLQFFATKQAHASKLIGIVA
jgi:hypothetical protein